MIHAGFAVLSVQDVTSNAAEIAERWHDARARHREPLIAREGEVDRVGEGEGSETAIEPVFVRFLG